MGHAVEGGWKVWVCPAFDHQTREAAYWGGGYALMTMSYTEATYAGVTSRVYLGHPNAISPYAGFGFGSGKPGGYYNWAQIYMAKGWWTYPDPAWGGAQYLIGDNVVRRLHNSSEAVLEVERFPAFGGNPAVGGGSTDDFFGGNVRHGGSAVKGGRWGSVLYADGHARGSNRMGPFTPWSYMCYTRAEEASGWPGGRGTLSTVMTTLACKGCR